jgi:CRP-like cAMP-binding protein
MRSIIPANGPNNIILQGLLDEEREILIASSVSVQLWPQEMLYRANGPLEHVYFPQSGLVSLVMGSQSGRAIETGLIGRQGLVGGEAVLSAAGAKVDALVQISGDAIRVPVALFYKAIKTSPILAGCLNEHLAWMLFQAQQNALCHAAHPIEARFARWLLSAGDAVGSSVLGISQERCSQILGVQRTSLSMVSSALQERGTINTCRGRIEILDHAKLQNFACECYLKLNQHALSRMRRERVISNRLCRWL